MTKFLLTAAFVATALIPSFAHAQSGTNVAVIDIKLVFDNHTRFKRMLDDIKREIEKFDGEIREKRKSLSTRAEGLRELVASSPEYKRLESQLAKEEADLQVEMSLKRKDILMREAEVYFDAYQEVLKNVSEFCDRHGIGLVLAFDSQQIDPTKRESVLKGVNRVVVFQRRLNITDHILQRLNSGIQPRDANSRNLPAIPNRPIRK